jgi:hypothetical protein
MASNKKGKASAAVDGASLREGTAVRVLYDDSGWFHGCILRVVGQDVPGGKTKCLVAFEDGETVEADFPAHDAQVCRSLPPGP